MNIRILKLSSLVPWEEHHTAHQIDHIRSCLRKHGQHSCIIVQAATNRIIAGNEIVSAMIVHGRTTAYCDVWDCTDEQAEAYRYDAQEARDAS